MSSRRMKNYKKRGALLKLGFIVYFGFCLFASVTLRTAVFNLEYELGELQTRKAGLVSEKRMIVAQRASYISVENVETLALKRLGMQLPERTKVFYVRNTEIAGPHKASSNIRR